MGVAPWPRLCADPRSDGLARHRTDAPACAGYGDGMRIAAGSGRCALLLCAWLGLPAAAPAQDAAALQARHAALRDALADSAFGRPLHLESSESGGVLTGDIYARIAQPYAAVGPALQAMTHWCDILILHENIKRCRAATAPGGAALSLDIGRKFDQELADAYAFELLYAVTSGPGYVQVALTAAEGPLGTSAYRIVLEVAALDDGASFVHLSYSYAHSLAARWATQVYLSTIGRAKVGFSVVARRSGGAPVYVGSTRGLLERNAMRCYLAIEAYLDALSVPGPQQLEARLENWYASIERYPLQLHEIERGEYLAMKRREVARQQSGAVVSSSAPGTAGGAP